MAVQEGLTDGRAPLSGDVPVNYMHGQMRADGRLYFERQDNFGSGQTVIFGPDGTPLALVGGKAGTAPFVLVAAAERRIAGAQPPHNLTPLDPTTHVPVAAALYGSDGANEYQASIAAPVDGAAIGYKRVFVDGTLALAGSTQTNVARDLSAAPTATGAGVLAVGGQSWTLSLNDAVPVPPGSDITNGSGAALTTADFAIRDTAYHLWRIPMAGWRRITFTFTCGAAFDQSLEWAVFGANEPGSFVPLLCAADLPASVAPWWSVGDAAAGFGTVAAATPIVHGSYFPAPGLSSGWNYLGVRWHTTVAPSAGSLAMYVTRSR